VFANAHASTPTRRGILADLFGWSGERVADAIEYAISQRNNHGISEAVGLVALGARLSGVHPDADRWLRDGSRWLDGLVLDQFAEDGWYVQHSLTYLRMALDQCVVGERVLRRIRGRGLSYATVARLRAAIALLLELHEPATGDVPNHGANDGSLVLPISTSGYRDFRPAITAAAVTFDVSLPESFQASGEALAWLGADPIARRPDASSTRVVTGSAGWLSARRDRTRVFVRAGEYQSNPSHIDPAHVDIWIDDEPRAVDAGTFRYTAPPPWSNGLATISVHNTVDVPSMPAAQKGARFLWLERPAASVTKTDESADTMTIEIRNRTWDSRGLTHVRRCILSDNGVDVFDELDSGPSFVELRVHWLVPDGVPLPEVESAKGGALSAVRASETSVEGWRSLYYAERHAATSVTFVMTVSGRATIHSRFVATNLRREP
jgi:Heparinase II/III-like protein/Heparinase II/III N-terminus